MTVHPAATRWPKKTAERRWRFRSGAAATATAFVPVRDVPHGGRHDRTSAEATRRPGLALAARLGTAEEVVRWGAW